jgi:hypothetical protein
MPARNLVITDAISGRRKLGWAGRIHQRLTGEQPMSFDISRLRRSEQIIGAGAIAFFIFLFFFKWYGGSSSTPLGGVSFSTNGWHTFHNSRWIWLITIVVALGVVAMTAAQRELKSPVSPSVIIAGLGALSSILILYRIIHHPSGGTSGTIAGVHYSASYGIKIGIWLGLIAAAAITYGGYLAMQQEGTSLSDVREQASSAFSGVVAAPGAPASPGTTPPAPSTGSEPTPSSSPPLPPPAAPASSEPAGEPPPASA